MTADDETNPGRREESEHMQRLKNVDHPTPFLGELEGMAVNDAEGTPMLFLHGTEKSCAVEVADTEFVDGLSRAGVEIGAILDKSPTESAEQSHDPDVFDADGHLWAGGVRDLEGKLDEYYDVVGIRLQAVYDDGDEVHHEAMVLDDGNDRHLLQDYVPVFGHGPSGATAVDREDLPSKDEVQEAAEA